jgi:CheY-like chemotaxis protein
MDKKLNTIMVLEDENLLLQAISKKLELSGLNPVSCTGAEQALDYLNSVPELPDAIWLDYHLKEMNGLTFMKKLKENPKWEKIPVVVVSNSASPDKVHSMLALGAKKYVLKAEYRLDEIIETIKEFVAKEEEE